MSCVLVIIQTKLIFIFTVRINEPRLPQNCFSKTVHRNHFTWGEKQKSNKKYCHVYSAPACVPATAVGFCRGRIRIRICIRVSNSLRFVLRCSYGGGVCIRQRAVGRVGAGTISVSVVLTDISLRGVLSGSYGLSLPLCIVDAVHRSLFKSCAVEDVGGGGGATFA